MVELFGAVLLLFGLSDLLFRFLGLGAYAHGSRRDTSGRGCATCGRCSADGRDRSAGGEAGRGF